MDNKQIPAADSKFQKIARANHKKWKIRLLSGGGQKADAGGGPYKKKPDYNRALSAPPGFGGLEEVEQLDEVIRKKGDKYCLFSKKTKKNLGCYPTRAGAVKREKQVQYFKHLKETIIREELYKAILEEDIFDDATQKAKELATGAKDWASKKLSSAFSDEKPEEAADTKKPSEVKKEEPVSGEKKALVYGHSQAGGLGLDLKKALDRKGYKVRLIIKNGANDVKLLSLMDEAGDPNQYNKVFLFAGGNYPYVPRIPEISAMIKNFGPDKTAVILPPVNTDKETAQDLSSRNQQNREGITKNFGGIVKVYIPVGTTKDFSDRIHVAAGSQASIKFANKLISDMDSVSAKPKNFIDDLKNALTSTDLYKAIESLVTKASTKSVDTGANIQTSYTNLKPAQARIAKLIEQRFIEAELPRNLALAAVVNSYFESSLNPNVTGDRAEKVSGTCARQVEASEGPKSPCGGGLFGIHSCGGMGGCRATGKGMTIEEIKDPEKSISRMISYIKKKGFDKRVAGKSIEETTYNFCYSMEVPANREIVCRNRANKSTTFFKEDLQEAKEKGKDDRCTRIAKRKYKAWPSAYASGAVVKCRQGKIWKSVKEEGQELDETKKTKHSLKKALAVGLAGLTAVTPPPDTIKPTKKSSTLKKEKELDEEWSKSERSKRKSKCSNPKGFTMKQFCKNQRTKSKQGEKTNE